MTTLLIELPDQKATAYKTYAQAQGLTVEEWFLQLAEQSALAPSTDPQTVVDDRPIWEVFADRMKDLSPEDLAALPKDGASQIDHYIYGHPKK